LLLLLAGLTELNLLTTACCDDVHGVEVHLLGGVG